MRELWQQQCTDLPAGSPALSPPQIAERMPQLHADWQLDTTAQAIERSFSFRNYYPTQAFVNAVVWIAHQQNHHPDICFGYNRCTVRFSTHSVGGLSENDLICAARVDQLQADAPDE